MGEGLGRKRDGKPMQKAEYRATQIVLQGLALALILSQTLRIHPLIILA
jgi:hypothetical protein